ncbi:MAG: hypothetical protein ACP5KY_02810 [Thermoproteus sp.]
MSRARTLKEIEDRRAQYSRYIWTAVALSMSAAVAGIAIYMAFGLPSYFLFGELPSAMLITSYFLSILAAITGYLSKSGVLRGEYGSAAKLLLAALAFSAVAIALSAVAFTPLMDNIVQMICQTQTAAVTQIPICISSFKINMYIAFGAYLIINIIAMVMYILSRRVLGLLFAYYAPRAAGRSRQA